MLMPSSRDQDDVWTLLIGIAAVKRFVEPLTMALHPEEKGDVKVEVCHIHVPIRWKFHNRNKKITLAARYTQVGWL